MRAVRAGLRQALPSVVVVAVILLAWEGLVRALAISPVVLPAPSRILSALWDARATAAGHAGATLAETIIGFGISVAFAVVTALVMDSVGWVRRALYPILVTSQTIPIVAVAPLLVIWFGPLGLLPKITVVVLVTFFPVTVALLDGLAGTDRDAMSLLQTMGASRSQILFKLRLPGALPSFFTGLRIAVTYAVIGAIFGEQVGAVNGLGIWMILSKNLFRTDLVFGAILITALLTLALWLLVGLAERLTIPWYRESRRSSA
jgi:ABC-type nitrate/sulfonate/bicarbonate transport system permease component